MIDNFTDTELTNEVWRDVDGYDGMYQVSDLGRVRSLKFGKVRVLRPGKGRGGYLIVDLSKENKKKTVKVHRLVAQAFIPNDDESKTIINHRNSIRDCNRVSNLEWCDSKYNNTYNDIHHRRKTKRRKVKDLYNPNLSYRQNLEIFRANGIECSKYTVMRLRKDLGLTNNKRNKLKDIYNPNLTYAQNIKIFRANGIECCEQTLWKLRRDLGLITK